MIQQHRVRLKDVLEGVDYIREFKRRKEEEGTEKKGKSKRWLFSINIGGGGDKEDSTSGESEAEYLLNMLSRFIELTSLNE